MKKFFCYGKNDFCKHNAEGCYKCKYYDGTGGECRVQESHVIIWVVLLLIVALMCLWAWASMSLCEQEPEPEPVEMPEIMVYDVPEEELEAVALYSSEDITRIAQTVYGEARGCSPEEQELVIWCILNRVDYNGTNIEDEVKWAAFNGYDPDNPVTPEIFEVTTQTLEKWACGEEALVFAPFATSPNYRYFYGDGQHNWFREEW